MDPKYIEFFLNSKSTVVRFETIEISHPDFSQVFRLVRNNSEGITATLEDGMEVDFEYLPMQIREQSTSDDLDFSIEINVGDLGELLPAEIDLVHEAGTNHIRPTVIYRSYRSDDLSSPMEGPIRLEIITLNSDKEGTTFTAAAPVVNLSRTGEIYSASRFTGLRGL